MIKIAVQKLHGFSREFDLFYENIGAFPVERSQITVYTKLKLYMKAVICGAVGSGIIERAIFWEKHYADD